MDDAEIADIHALTLAAFPRAHRNDDGADAAALAYGIGAPVAFSAAARERLASMADPLAQLDRIAERERMRKLGVDPGRVIDGELGRKEIERG